MDFSKEVVEALSRKTGCGKDACLVALKRANGSFKKAEDILSKPDFNYNEDELSLSKEPPKPKTEFGYIHAKSSITHSSTGQVQGSGIDESGNIIDLNALYNALLSDKRSITIKDPALNEYKVLMAKDTKALKNMLSGGGKGFALGLAGSGLSFIPVIGPVLALDLTVAGLFSCTKALTYDLAMGIKSDNELKAVQQEIREKYSNVDLNKSFELMKKWYTVTSEGNSFVTLTHK